MSDEQWIRETIRLAAADMTGNAGLNQPLRQVLGSAFRQIIVTGPLSGDEAQCPRGILVAAPAGRSLIHSRSPPTD